MEGILVDVEIVGCYIKELSSINTIGVKSVIGFGP